MPDYESCYNSARGRYYTACSEIRNCENRIYSYTQQRQQKIADINKLNTDIINAQEALRGVEQVLKSNDTLYRKNSAVSTKTEQASDNYSKMIKSSDVISKILTEVYREEMSGTKSNLDNIVNTLKNKKTDLTNKLNELKKQLSQAKTDLQNIEEQLRSDRSSCESWNNSKRSAANDMEYYRRKMQEEASLV